MWGGAPRNEDRYAAPYENSVLGTHNGGAHGAPARERRGVSGPRKRPSRGVGRSPTLDRYAAPYENFVLVTA